jgi:phage tail-like protein
MSNSSKVYPLPQFHYQVSWGNEKIGFSEVSGLNHEIQMIEYRHGEMKTHYSVKMPGLCKYGNLTFKRGMHKESKEIPKWLKTVKMNTVERKDLTISLLNENHEAVITWKALQCFIVKYEGPAMKAAGNEVAIESVEIAIEHLEIQN